MQTAALAIRLLFGKPMKQDEYGVAFESGYSATRRYLLANGAPVEEAEEIAQAAWVRGWEYRAQLRDPRMLGFWVNSIARNLFRARFRGPLKVSIDGQNPAYQMDMASFELRRMMERCSRKDQSLIQKTLEGYSTEEMARDAGITPTGIRVRLLRIRQSLRAQTREHTPKLRHATPAHAAA
jgi:DNA-directed RNA polymerase specialized sigma24 family protein